MELVAHGQGPGAPIPPTVVYLAGLALGWWIDSVRPVALRTTGLTGPETMLGWALVIAGLALFVWGLRTFARARTGIMLQHAAHRVVRAGPYQWSRNPQYVGFTSAYVGAALLMNTVWPLALLPLVLMTIEIGVIAREERYLRSTFGPLYDEYCRSVRRWL